MEAVPDGGPADEHRQSEECAAGEHPVQSPLPQSPADHPDVPTSSAPGSGNGLDKPLNFSESRIPPVSGPPISSQKQNCPSEQSTGGFPPKQSTGFQQHDQSRPQPLMSAGPGSQHSHSHDKDGRGFHGDRGGFSANSFGAQGPRGPNSNFGPRGPQINRPKRLMSLISLMDLDVKPFDDDEKKEYVESEVPYPPMSHPGARGVLRPMRGQPLNRGPYNGRGGRGMPPMRGQMRQSGPYPIMGAMPPRGGIRPMGAYPPIFQTPYQESDYDEGQNEGVMAEEYDESAMYPAEEETEHGYGEHGDAGQEAEWGAETEESNYSEERPPPHEYQQDRHKRLSQYPDPEWREGPRDLCAETEIVDSYDRRIDPPAKRYHPYRPSPLPEFDRRRLCEQEDPYGSRSPSRLYRDRYPPEKPEETPFVFAETIDYDKKSASGKHWVLPWY